MDIYLNRKRIKLTPQQAIGKGGEADIFAIDKNQAVKIFKQPDHPDYFNSPLAQQAAKERLQEHQTKLRQFPHNLPNNVIAPQQLVTDKSGNQILGYTMPLLKNIVPLLKYSDRAFRSQSGINQQTVIDIFSKLHQTVQQIHKQQVIMGDFNDLNILISGTDIYLIDADSFQYQNFLCRVFTARFVDPILCDANQNQPILIKTHNANSDWYAFSVMLMQCLLFVDPYGGIYKPQDKSQQIPQSARPLKRITVFNSEVKYPKPALPYKILPDDLLQYFHRCFEQDYRGEFPQNLLHNLAWTKCNNCGNEHARNLCPYCTQIQPQLQPQVTVIVRGQVQSTLIFETKGIILLATVTSTQLNYLYYEQGTFKRENKQTLFNGDLDRNLQFWLNDKATLIGKQGQVITLGDSGSQSRLAVDSYQDKLMLQSNHLGRYWLSKGQLLKDGKLGAEYIGDILTGQTQFWVGYDFGFGFYYAGNLKIAFVFDVNKPGINDQVKLPSWQGELIEANCIFSNQYAWLFLITQSQGKLIYHINVIRANGQVIAHQQLEATANSWLHKIYGHCAVNNFLLVATDEGIVRIEIEQDRLIKAKEFPDSEPFVDSSCSLLAGKQGLYVVSQHKIQLLQM